MGTGTIIPSKAAIVVFICIELLPLLDMFRTLDWRTMGKELDKLRFV